MATTVKIDNPSLRSQGTRVQSSDGVATSPLKAPASAPARQTWIESACALGVFTAVFAWWQRGWLAQAHDSVPMTAPGGFADAQLIVWVLDWVARRLRSDFGRILDAPINYPEPGQLTGSEHFATAQLLFFPLDTATANPILAANLTAMVFYSVTAWAMFVFLRSLGIRTLPAMFGGFSLALGPFQIPGNLHILQLLPVFFPLTAWALHRLRINPNARTTVLCGFVYVAGLMSSFYIAFLLSVFYVGWALVELLRRADDRRQFTIAAGVAFATPIALFIVLSLPYLNRPEIDPNRGLTWTMQGTKLAIRQLVRIFGEHKVSLGSVSTSVALLGIAAFFRREFRVYAGACGAFAIGGIFLYIGGLQVVASWQLPGPLGAIATFVGQFFRIFPRGLVLTAFAFATIGALGLETIWRRAPRLGAATAALATVLLVGIRGPVLANPYIYEVAAFTEHEQAYRDLARIASNGSAGSLLELPRRGNPKTADAEAMMGQMIHGVPLITGHTGYLPARRVALDQILRRPLDRSTLGELLRSATGLRWIVVRPQRSWSRRGEYGKALRALRSSARLATEHRLGRLHVFEMLAKIQSEPSRPSRPCAGDRHSCNTSRSYRIRSYQEMGWTDWQTVEGDGFDFEEILYDKCFHDELHGGVARVTLNKPERSTTS